SLASHVFFDKTRVTPLACLIASNKPAAISGIGHDDPELRMVICNILISIGTPLLDWPADPIDSQFLQYIRRLVQCLSQVLNTTPYKNMYRPRIVGSSPFNNPFRSFSGSANPLIAGTFRSTLLRDRPQCIRRGIFVGIAFQLWVVLLVMVDHLKDVLFPP